MSTQINVIVDNGGLSAKAKQQIQANRWAKLEADAQNKIAQATKEQNNLQETAPDRPSALRTFRGEDLAASRRSSDEYFCLVPDGPPVNNRLTLQHRGFLSQLSVVSGVAIVRDDGFNRGELCAWSEPRGNYVRLTGAFPESGVTSKWKDGISDFTLQIHVTFDGGDRTDADWVDVVVRVGNNGYIQLSHGLKTLGTTTATRRRVHTLACRFRGATSVSSVEIIDLTENLYPAANTIDLRPGTPHSFVVRKSGRTVQLYVDKVKQREVIVNSDLMVFNPASPGNWVDVAFGPNQLLSYPAPPTYISNLRFDAKALRPDEFWNPVPTS